MAAGRPSLKTSGRSGIEGAWPRADASSSPGCCGGVEDVVDRCARSGWSEVVGYLDASFREQAAAVGRAGPGGLGFG
jgi:hypothetical protein